VHLVGFIIGIYIRMQETVQPLFS